MSSVMLTGTEDSVSLLDTADTLCDDESAAWWPSDCAGSSRRVTVMMMWPCSDAGRNRVKFPSGDTVALKPAKAWMCPSAI